LGQPALRHKLLKHGSGHGETSPTTVRARHSEQRSRIGEKDLLRLRIYIDVSVIETFVDGEVPLTDPAYPANVASLGLGLFAKAGTARLRSITLWELAPISGGRLTSGAERFRV